MAGSKSGRPPIATGIHPSRGAEWPGLRSTTLGGRTLSRYSAALCSLVAGLAALTRLQAAAAPQPDYNAPWVEPEKKTAPTKKSEKSTAAPAAATTHSPAGSTTVSTSPAPVPPGLDTKTALRPPKPAKNQVSVSGDFMLGQGNVTIPAGYALNGSGIGISPSANTATRSSEYFGGTVSYSYGQAWYLDVGFAQGDSRGTVPFSLTGIDFDTKFTIKDEWYQAYLRYAFPKLRGRKLSAYLRAGVSYVQADLSVIGPAPGFGLYKQTDATTDLLGNLGFGVGYSLMNGRRFRVGLQGEAEGFFGTRSQKISERVFADRNPNGTPELASINNTLFGVVARATVRFEYRMGQSGLFKAFGEGGFQLKESLVQYPGVGSSNELLWGPYVKLGVSYSF